MNKQYVEGVQKWKNVYLRKKDFKIHIALPFPGRVWDMSHNRGKSGREWISGLSLYIMKHLTDTPILSEK